MRSERKIAPVSNKKEIHPQNPHGEHVEQVSSEDLEQSPSNNIVSSTLFREKLEKRKRKKVIVKRPIKKGLKPKSTTIKSTTSTTSTESTSSTSSQDSTLATTTQIYPSTITWKIINAQNVETTESSTLKTSPLVSTTRSDFGLINNEKSSQTVSSDEPIFANIFDVPLSSKPLITTTQSSTTSKAPSDSELEEDEEIFLKEIENIGGVCQGIFQKFSG